jgi:hypothetical protein
MNRKSPSKLATLALIGTTALSTGCASIISGPTQNISVNSTPPGATIKVNQMSYGKTPGTVHLRRKEVYNIKLELEGYIDKYTRMRVGYNPAASLNLLFGGPIGYMVDYFSGSLFRFRPDSINATLEKDPDYKKKLAEKKLKAIKENSQLEPKTSGGSNIVDKLLGLKKLREAEIITQEEFEKKRKELVNQL